MPHSPLASRWRRFWSHDIWAAGLTNDRSLKGRALGFLRIASITLSGLREIHVAIRAAALSYSSLLALGPLVAIAVLISGFALGNRDPALAARSLSRVIGFIAPQVGQYDQAEAAENDRAAHGAAARPSAKPAPRSLLPGEDAPPDPELVQMITTFISSSRSGTAGVVGVLTLFLIVIGLFTTIENTFNDIWGVRRGRSLFARIVYYWTVITLGALLFFASLTLFSAGAFLNVFFARVPLGAQLKSFFVWSLPAGSVLLLILILTLFYRLVPHTRVKWSAALLGAVIVTGLLFLNNYLAFLYFKRVLISKSLYGSVSIMPVLMVGLYIFWFFVLVGGQITYAVQNRRYRASQTAWHNLNHSTRESMSLVVLLLIARRFKASAPAYAVSELSQVIRVPAQVLNESLNRLGDMGLVSELPPADGAEPNDHRYQPARPLNQITLGEFRRAFEAYGETSAASLLSEVDPILARYREEEARFLTDAWSSRHLDQLIDEMPARATYSPFPADAR